MYDIAIVGGGPIGAATAYFLSQKTKGKVALITDDPENDSSVTYRAAGGCIRTFWDEPTKREMTTQTAKFVKELIDKGVELSAIEDYYHFVYRGAFTPALNISGTLLVQHLIAESAKNGIEYEKDTRLESVSKSNGHYELSTSGNTIKANKVLLALGVSNESFVPNLKLDHEKRQLFVLNLPVDESRKLLPHTIVPVGDGGYGYVFLKKINGELKVVLGQEDIIEDDDESGPVDYFDQLLKSDLTKIMPWLKSAKCDKILWGIDAGNKELNIYEDGSGLYAANCGSSVRSCVWIGNKLADRLTE